MSARILFVCIHNSARSQMAEAFVNHRLGQVFTAESAGIEPGRLNPMVVAAMAEVGIDLSRNRTKTVAEVIAAGPTFDHVVTVCDEANAERCPVVPGAGARTHLGFADPSALQGDDASKLARTRVIRDDIERRVLAWCASLRVS